jgi:hypothetical protein
VKNVTGEIFSFEQLQFILFFSVLSQSPSVPNAPTEQQAEIPRYDVVYSEEHSDLLPAFSMSR